MDKKNIFLILLISLISLSLGVFLKLQSNKLQQPSVKGTSTTSSVDETIASYTMTPTPTIASPTPLAPTTTPRITNTHEKEYGGWYWNEEEGVSKQWLGTDSEGNDVWSESNNNTNSTNEQSSPSSNNTPSQASHSSQQTNNNSQNQEKITSIPDSIPTSTPTPAPIESNTNYNVEVTKTPAPATGSSGVGVVVKAEVNNQ